MRITIKEAQEHLPELINVLKKNNDAEIIITENGDNIASLNFSGTVKTPSEQRPNAFGIAKGKIKYPDNLVEFLRFDGE